MLSAVMTLMLISSVSLLLFLLIQQQVTFADGLGGKTLYLYDGEDAVTEYYGSSSGLKAMTAPHVVKFYSPYCGHCVRFKSRFIELSKEAREALPAAGVKFLAVSCAAHSDVCKDFGILAYPSVYVFNLQNPDGKILFEGSTVKTDVLITAISGETDVAGQNVKQVTRQLESNDAKANDDGKDGDDEDSKDREDDNDDDEAPNGVEKDSDDEDDKSEKDEEDDEDEDENIIHERADEDRKDSEDDDNLGEKDSDDNNSRDSDDIDIVDDDDNEDDDDVVASREMALEEKKFEKKKGAEAAKMARRDMDRWKDQIAANIEGEVKGRRGRPGFRKPRLRQQDIDEPIHDGATNTMKGNIPGTKEFEERRKQLLAAIRQHRGRKPARHVEQAMNELPAVDVAGQLPDGRRPFPRRPPFRKQITRPKLVERLPVMNRMHKLSDEEQLILDITLSFMHALKVGVYRSNGPLNDFQKKALADWFSMLRLALPQEWALHDLIDDLLDNIDYVSNGSDNLETVVDRHPIPRISWSDSCGGLGKIGGGFTCGFWKLLHSATVGIAEYKGGLNLEGTRTLRQDATILSPEAAADVIREYISNFFPCTECSNHFVQRYDDCSYRRCARLTDNAEDATDSDWKELAKWMWEVHNEVTVRLLHEKATRNERSNLAISSNGARGPTVDDEIKIIWPNMYDCVKCFNLDGTWNEDAVFIHLERTYWPAPSLDSKAARLLTFDPDVVGWEFDLTLFLVLAFVVLIYYMRQSLFSNDGLQEAILRARALGTRGISKNHKRSV